MDELPAVLRLRRRAATAAHRCEPRDDLSVWAVPDRRRQDGDARPAERARVGSVLRESAAAAGTREGRALREQLQTQRGARGTARIDRRGLRDAERERGAD